MKLPPNIYKEIFDLSDALEISKVLVKKQRVRINNKLRTLAVPNDYAKLHQKKVYKLFSVLKFPDYVFSQKNYFFADMARYHLGADYLVSVDIKDFFPSIHFKRVAALLEKFGLNGIPAKKLLYLVTFDKSLPLGFPTSSLLSNLILLEMDKNLERFCRSKGYKYSRYADDLTISGPSAISVNFLRKIFGILKQYNFRVNNSKLKIFGREDQKIVLGLLLKEGEVDISEAYLNKIKEELSMLRLLKKNSCEYQDLLKTVKGELSFIKQVNKITWSKLNQKYGKILR